MGTARLSSILLFFFRKCSVCPKTHKKLSIYNGGLASLGLRKISIADRKLVFKIFLSIGCTFQWGKIQVGLKILIMAHRCQKCNKNSWKKKLSSNRGGAH